MGGLQITTAIGGEHVKEGQPKSPSRRGRTPPNEAAWTRRLGVWGKKKSVSSNEVESIRKAGLRTQFTPVFTERGCQNKGAGTLPVADPRGEKEGESQAHKKRGIDKNGENEELAQGKIKVVCTSPKS